MAAPVFVTVPRSGSSDSATMNTFSPLIDAVGPAVMKPTSPRLVVVVAVVLSVSFTTSWARTRTVPPALTVPVLVTVSSASRRRLLLATIWPAGEISISSGVGRYSVGTSTSRPSTCSVTYQSTGASREAICVSVSAVPICAVLSVLAKAMALSYSAWRWAVWSFSTSSRRKFRPVAASAACCSSLFSTNGSARNCNPPVSPAPALSWLVR